MSTIPANLYKYQGVPKRDIATLIDGDVYYPAPPELNDPFDCQISMDSSDIPESEMARLTIGLMGIAAEEKQATIKFSRDEDYPLRQRFDYLCEDFLSCIFDFGIYSLSEEPTNPLMWSHYASNFHGFVIEYDTSKPTMEGVVETLFPVQYSESVPHLNFQEFLENYNTTVAPVKMITTKGDQWRYEKEWRIIIRGGGRRFRMPFSVSKIIFGHCLEIDYRKHLKDHFGDSIQYRVAAPSERHYRVELHNALTGRSRQSQPGLIRPHRKRGTYYFNNWREH